MPTPRIWSNLELSGLAPSAYYQSGIEYQNGLLSGLRTLLVKQRESGLFATFYIYRVYIYYKAILLCKTTFYFFHIIMSKTLESSASVVLIIISLWLVKIKHIEIDILYNII